MRFTIFLSVVLLVGCASPTQETDVDNSPCACLPFLGEQLPVSPRVEDLEQIKNEVFS